MDKQSHWEIVQQSIDKYTEDERQLSPIRVKHALNEVAQVAFGQGESYALLSLMPTANAALKLGVTERRIRALAKSRNIGWQVSRGTWLFRPEDIDKLRPGPCGRPPKSK